MMGRGRMLRLGALLLYSAAMAGCGGPGADLPSGSANAKTEYMTVGVFNSANAEGGTVNLSHEPVPSAGWPAMTMDFKLADPSAVEDLQPGQRVDIHFTIEDQGGMNARVTYLEPID